MQIGNKIVISRSRTFKAIGYAENIKHHDFQEIPGVKPYRRKAPHFLKPMDKSSSFPGCREKPSLVFQIKEKIATYK